VCPALTAVAIPRSDRLRARTTVAPCPIGRSVTGLLGEPASCESLTETAATCPPTASACW
jgi:hypothetical protein